MVIELYEYLAMSIWKFTFANTSAVECIIICTLAMKRVLVNLIKRFYAPLGSFKPTILFEYL